MGSFRAFWVSDPTLSNYKEIAHFSGELAYGRYLFNSLVILVATVVSGLVINSMSYGFDDGRYLAWSIEVRRVSGGSFSPLADLFKNSPLVILAADERDVIGLRANFRGEDVQIYRLKASPAAARLLLREYVSDANALAVTPAFYNSLTTNCTTTIIKMMRVAGDAVPTDWRLIVNGYLPEYAYDRGALDTSVSLSQLRSAAHIAARAHKDGLSPIFSQAIRVGVPSPQGAL